MTFLNQFPPFGKPCVCQQSLSLLEPNLFFFSPPCPISAAWEKKLYSISFPDSNIHSESKLTKSREKLEALSSFLWSSALSASCPHIPWSDWRTFPSHFWGSVLASLRTAFMANFFIGLILNWITSFLFFPAANFPCFTNEDYHFC